MDTKQAQSEKKKNIIELFEIDKLPEEKQEEMINKIGTSIFQSVLVRVLPLLEEKDAEAYDKLLEESASPEDLLDFFFEKVPDFMQIVDEESENFRREAGEILAQIK